MATSTKLGRDVRTPVTGMRVDTGRGGRVARWALRAASTVCAAIGIAGPVVAGAVVEPAGEGPIVQQARLFGGGGPGADGEGDDRFGYAVAVDGDTMVVGTPGDDLGLGSGSGSGSASVFVRSPSGTWSLQAKLSEPGGSGYFSVFGAAVAIDGETLVIGAPGAGQGAVAPSGGVPGRGAAFVYTRKGGQWSLAASLSAPAANPGSRFGQAVALAGGRIVVGAPLETVSGQAGRGAAYVFESPAGSWSLAARIVAADGGADDRLGMAVAVAGDALAIGAVGDDRGAVDAAGSVRIYERIGPDWVEAAQLEAATPTFLACFGRAIAATSDLLLVGAPGPQECDDAAQGNGSAHLFARTASGWQAVGNWPTQSVVAADGFGTSVAISGDQALVGAPVRAANGVQRAGAVVVFARAGGAWSERSTLAAPDSLLNGRFGAAVAFTDDGAVVGMSGDALGDRGGQGSVRVLVGIGAAWSQGARVDMGPGKAYSRFGAAVAIDGETLAAGAPDDERRGAVRVFARSGGTWALQAAVQAPVPFLDEDFGHAVALDGDTLAVGAPNLGGVVSPSTPGAVHVYRRLNAQWLHQATLSAPEGQVADYFGFSVVLRGDVLVAGAPGRGLVHVFRRQGAGWQAVQQLAPPSVVNRGGFGRAVALVEGLLAVGAPETFPAGGTVHLYALGAGGWSLVHSLTATDGQAGDRFGEALALSRDGLLVGAPGDREPTSNNVGSARWYLRMPTTWVERFRFFPSPAAPTAEFGSSVALLDGVVIVAATTVDVALERSIADIHVHRLRADGTVQLEVVRPVGPSGMGPIAAAGSTLVLGAPATSQPAPWGNFQEGSAYVFTGLPASLFADGFE